MQDEKKTSGECASVDSECPEDCCPDCAVPEGALARTLMIVNRKGLHARATAKLVQCIDGFDAEVTVGRCGEIVGGTSIMGILTLGAAKGMTITVSATGVQAEEVLEAIAVLVADRFGEEE